MPQMISGRLSAAYEALSALLPFPVRIALAYYFLISLITFFLFLHDKRLAVGNRWRIPEAVLLGWAALGGAAGALCGMRIFRHKTRKPKFTVLVPLFLLLHAAVLIFLYLLGGKP